MNKTNKQKLQIHENTNFIRIYALGLNRINLPYFFVELGEFNLLNKLIGGVVFWKDEHKLKAELNSSHAVAIAIAIEYANSKYR